MSATDFENELVKYKDQIDMSDEALGRYQKFFGFNEGDLAYIDNEVLKLIELIKVKRFSEIFK